MTFTGEAPVLSLHQPWAQLCFTPAAPVCPFCNDTHWTEDQDWEPAYPHEALVSFEKTPENGIVPCGWCSLGEWCNDWPPKPPRMVKTIETRSWRTKHRGRLWIAATASAPRFGLAVGGWIVGLGDYPDERSLGGRPNFHPRLPLPLGCIIGSVEVVDCLPMVDVFTPGDGDCILLPGDSTAAVVRSVPVDRVNCGIGSSVDISDQLPYGDFTPGRWAWVMENPELLPEPVPFKGGQGLTKRWKP